MRLKSIHVTPGYVYGAKLYYSGFDKKEKE